MSTTPEFHPPSDIHVHRYRQILLLPVLLESMRSGEGDEHATPTSQWRQWSRTLQQGGWQQVDSLPQARTPPGITDFSGCEPTYEEVVYFHPFARDLLYGDGGKDQDERAMLRFRRVDVTDMRVTLDVADLPHRRREDSAPSGNLVEFEFQVPRVELYLCKPLVAILVIEVVWQESAAVAQLCLADVLVLQSRVRELYPPFFMGDTPGNCPRRVVWLGPSRSGAVEEKAASDFERGREHFARQVELGAEPPVASHWAFFVKPIEPFLKREGHGPLVRQIIDDRLPGLTYVAVDDPRLIHEGDFDRLAFCETGGDTPFPYSADFLAEERSRHTYDRYWRATADHDSSQERGTRLNTRYLCSGFQFVVVGSWHNWFFANLIQDHVRRHYFRLALIAHFQRAALLKFADDMSEAIKMLKGRSPRQELSDEKFRNHVEQLQMTFLKFVSRVWFGEVSNQLQGQELFHWWSDLLGNQRLFAEVQQMNDSMHSMLTNHDSRDLARRTLEVSVFAVVIAAISVIIALSSR